MLRPLFALTASCRRWAAGDSLPLLLAAGTNDRYMFARLAALRLTDGSRLGDKALGAITEDDLEALAVALRVKGRAASTRNQYVQLLKASCRWATRKGYCRICPRNRHRHIQTGHVESSHRSERSKRASS